MSSYIPPLQKPPGYRDPTLPIRSPQPLPYRANLPSGFYPSKRRRKNHCKICCCCFCISFAIILLLLIITISTFYLSFNPKFPVIQLTSLEFTKLNSTTTPEGPMLDVSSIANVVVKNPNSQLKMVYGKTSLSLTSQGGASFGSAKVPGFIQDRKHVKELNFTIATGRKFVTEKQANEVKNGLKNKNNLKIIAQISSKVSVRYGSFVMASPQVNVICKGLSLKQIEAGKKPECNFKWF